MNKFKYSFARLYTALEQNTGLILIYKHSAALHLTYLSLRRARHRDYKGAHVPERASFSWRAEAEPYSL